MKPFTFFMGVSALIFILISGYFYSSGKATFLYSGAASTDVLCTELAKFKETQNLPSVVSAFTNSLCSNESQNTLKNAWDVTNAKSIQASFTKQGRVLTKITSSTLNPESSFTGFGTRVMRGMRFFYDTLMQGDELPFAFSPENIAWYAFSRDLGSTGEALVKENKIFARLLNDLSQEYLVPFMSLMKSIHEVHVVKYRGGNEYMLIVRDASPERLVATASAIEQFVTHGMAARFPQEIPHRLPDSSLATELIFNPSRFAFVPQHQGAQEIRVLKDNTRHISFYDTIIGDRFIMTTSEDRLGEVSALPRENTLWRAISRGCNNYFSSIAHDGVFLALLSFAGQNLGGLAQGFWYGAMDATAPHTISGCFMDTPWMQRVQDRAKWKGLTFPLFYL